MLDEDLMMAFGSGDMQAFEELYNRYRNTLYRYLLRQLPKAEAEDIFQDIWAKVIGARLTYQPTAAFKTWLFTIVHNRMSDYWRSRQRSVEDRSDNIPDPPGNPGDEPERQLQSQQGTELLLRLIDSLPEEQRTCFLLKQEVGLTLFEIAEVTGATGEAAKSRLRYALAKLRVGLEAVYAD